MSAPCKRGHTGGRYESTGRCIECRREDNANWRRNHPDRVRAAAAKVPRASREKNRVYGARYRARNPEREWRRLGVIGPIPPKPVLGRCEACGDIPLTLHMDHDHATGLFRGWLCSLCNTGLGHARDSIQRLRLLINYLETKSCQPTVY